MICDQLRGGMTDGDPMRKIKSTNVEYYVRAKPFGQVCRLVVFSTAPWCHPFIDQRGAATYVMFEYEQFITFEEEPDEI